MTNDAQHLNRLRARIDDALERLLPPERGWAPRLQAAMRYAVLSGGKRIRPLVTLATTESLDGDVELALAPACAVELIHAYSLVHDDLPAMDDDDLRRGRPTVHVAFDEATAILAGDALQALAFETLAAAKLPADTRMAMSRALARAIGWRGMVGGQAIDMASTGGAIALDELESMHRGKTGALLVAAVELGALAASADEQTRAQLSRFAAAIGLAFQIVDDLLDVTSDVDQLGKATGVDAEAGKNTFPGKLGVAASRTRCDALVAEALQALGDAGIEGGSLPAIAMQVVDRRN
jgi:geranylgeranyl pyrophosphate synthase